MGPCLEASHLLGDLKVPSTGVLWAEACKHASDLINMPTRVEDKPFVHSSYRKFYGRKPLARLLQFLKPGFQHVNRTLKLEPKGIARFCSGGNHHPMGCCKILLLSGYRWEYDQCPDRSKMLRESIGW